MNQASPLKVVEFFSGIGGMHYALQETGLPFEVIAAYDINTTANEIYRHNFPNTKLCQNNIQSLTSAQLDKFDADLWTMSPPCQPFTSKGLQLGEKDRRCDALKWILDCLEGMAKLPRHIFLENVVGFETSPMHTDTLTTLQRKGYTFEQYILSPVQLGIPNKRPRYYLLASIHSAHHREAQEIRTTHPKCCDDVAKIGQFISPEFDDPSLTLRDEDLKRFAASLDVVTEESRKSACFTKSYGTYMTGCGSYFTRDADMVSGNRIAEGKAPKLRRFSPREVASLMCFPETFSWPATTTSKQLYRTLGNSINVHVVSVLLAELLTDESTE